MSQQTLQSLGEAGLLRRLRQLLGRPWQHAAQPRAALRRGVGDDAALVPVPPGQAGAYTVLSCDMLIEDVDFRRRWASFADVGHKAAAVNLSDMAAMGATPAGLLLSLALSPSEKVTDVLALVRSLDRVGRRFGAPLLGGDLSSTRGPLVVAVTAMGYVGRGRRRGGSPLSRHGGQVGDVVLVGGPLGAARAGLALLEGEAAFAGLACKATWTRQRNALLRHQRRPEPQVALGQLLARVPGVHAAVDLSDGLAADALHLPKKGCGVVLDVRALPLAAGVQKLASCVPQAAQSSQPLAPGLAWALTGGEDFVLAVAVAKGAHKQVRAQALRAGFVLTPVGRITATPGLHLVGCPAQEKPRGFDHFSR